MAKCVDVLVESSGLAIEDACRQLKCSIEEYEYGKAFLNEIPLFDEKEEESQ